MIYKEVIFYYEKGEKNTNICYNKETEEIIEIKMINKRDKKENDEIKERSKKVECKKISEKCLLFISENQNNNNYYMTDMIYMLNFYKKEMYICIQKNAKNEIIEYLKNLEIIDESKIIILEENIRYEIEEIKICNEQIKTNKKIELMKNMNKKLKIKRLEYYPEKIFILSENINMKLKNSNEIIEMMRDRGYYILNNNIDLEIKNNMLKKCKKLVCELGNGCNNIFYLEKETSVKILTNSSIINKYLFYNNVLNLEIEEIHGKIINKNNQKIEWIINQKLINEKIL